MYDNERNDYDSDAEMVESMPADENKYSRLEIMEVFDKIESYFAPNKMPPENRLFFHRYRFALQMHNQLKLKKTPSITTFMGPPRPKQHG